MSVFQRKSDGRWLARVKIDGRVRHFTGTDRDDVVARAAQYDPALMEHSREESRFWTKVERGTNCWLWTGGRVGGYGVFRPEASPLVRAHRYAYENRVGPIPDGMVLDHLCRNAWCVRPSHLEPVTHSENHRRRRSKRWDFV